MKYEQQATFPRHHDPLDPSAYAGHQQGSLPKHTYTYMYMKTINSQKKY